MSFFDDGVATLRSPSKFFLSLAPLPGTHHEMASGQVVCKKAHDDPEINPVKKVALQQFNQIAQGSAKNVWASVQDKENVYYIPRMFKKGELRSEIQTAREIKETLASRNRISTCLAIDYEEVELLGQYAVRTPAMEKGSLDTFLKKNETSVFDRLQLGLGLLTGLDELHDAGKMHGDLKPDNFLVGNDNALKLSDFGKTRQLFDYTDPAAYVGNQMFASPEGVCSKEGEVASAAFNLIHLLENGNPEGIAKILGNRYRTLVGMTLGVTPLDPKTIDRIHAHIDQLVLKLEKEKGAAAGTMSHLGMLLKSMAALNPALRPSSEAALRVYSEIVTEW